MIVLKTAWTSVFGSILRFNDAVYIYIYIYIFFWIKPKDKEICWERLSCAILGIIRLLEVESSWNEMAHGAAREGKWKGNWRMEWVASTLHTTSEHGVSSITTADEHTSAVSRRLNWRPRRFKWTRPFCRKTKSGFCTCAITFQTQCNIGRHWDVNLPGSKQCKTS